VFLDRDDREIRVNPGEPVGRRSDGNIAVNAVIAVISQDIGPMGTGRWFARSPARRDRPQPTPGLSRMLTAMTAKSAKMVTRGCVPVPDPNIAVNAVIAVTSRE
jgi:hypothetical protein